MPAGQLALIAALALGLHACTRPHPPGLVVWVEIDTLRADALGCYGNAALDQRGNGPSPGIDAVVEGAVRFERAYAPAPWTIPSLATQLTGLWPHEHGAQRIARPLDATLDTLPEVLQGAGWRTAGVTTNFVTKEAVTPGFRQGFERWHEGFATGHEGGHAAEALDRLAADATELLEQPGDGVFLFALLFEPHYRYEEHEAHRFGSGEYRGDLTGHESLADLRARRAQLGAADAAFLRGRYHSEVASVDAAVEGFLAGPWLGGLREDALIVIVADHGEELLDRGWIGHTVTLKDELVRVPLILKLPGGAHAGEVVAETVSLVDLPATVLDYAMDDPPSLGRSRSLRGLIEGGPAPRRWLLLHSDFDPPLQTDGASEKRTLKWGVVDGARRLKLVQDRLAGSTALHDLAADPGERDDLAATGRAELDELRAALEALERGEEPR